MLAHADVRCALGRSSGEIVSPPRPYGGLPVCTQNEFEMDSGVRTQPLVNQIDLLTKRVREFESFFRGVEPNPWGCVRGREGTVQNRERGFQVVERQPRANG